MSNTTQEPLIEVFIYETNQLLEQLEQNMIEREKEGYFDDASINEIFRIMHTIKGSAAMMQLESMAALAHEVENIFYFIRENSPGNIEFGELVDIIFSASDFMNGELLVITEENECEGNSDELINAACTFLNDMKMCNQQKKSEEISAINTENIFGIKIYFDDDCGMEGLRAFTVSNELEQYCEKLKYCSPESLDGEDVNEQIVQMGFQTVVFSYEPQEVFEGVLSNTAFIKEFAITDIKMMKEDKNNIEEKALETCKESVLGKKEEHIKSGEAKDKVKNGKTVHQSLISVNVNKLDLLMDLVGEMVITEAMVLQNPDLMGLKLDNFQKSARQLQKITNELRDVVMEIRMVPLAPTFKKMERIVRDMSRKLDKEVKLKLVGESTEVDKNIIENISDPLIHLVRNSIDHGIESYEKRKELGKPKEGTITLEAKNIGNDVLIIVQDDGYGLDRQKILEKAENSGLLTKNPDEMSNLEVYNMIFLPGFSTEESVSEFSGRGVGMDVVMKNISNIGGIVSIDSKPGLGTKITLKLPLTLAIIDGMTIGVGEARYTVPLTTIKQSFRPSKEDVLRDPDENEMIMVRGECLPIIRLYKYFEVETNIVNFEDGIFIMVEQSGKSMCIFADQLIGQQQVVVKSLPNYIKNTKKIEGLSGCTLLGDGSISLILDIANLLKS